ncbi:MULTISPECIES: ogr/Delta-like zinc finger family protein [Billgrantia]|uniref:Transcriptional regulator n=2 Tax=Billgrantia TaxID=3137761 RepID=A0ABS9AQ20_9GAMM|nr:transcriptional regulator [Halomonas ethanolica]MCE8023650.1 transcriptional regulator [Halomonas aerodenitrificans]
MTHSRRLSCPHCGSSMRIRNSVGITPVYREAWVHCSDEVGCGFRAKMGMELIHTTCPSAKPNPDVQLPPAPSLLAQLMNEAN